MVGVLPKYRIRGLMFLAKTLRQAKDILSTRLIKIVFCFSKVHCPFVISIIPLNRFLIKIDTLNLIQFIYYRFLRDVQISSIPRVHIIIVMCFLIRIYTITVISLLSSPLYKASLLLLFFSLSGSRK